MTTDYHEALKNYAYQYYNNHSNRGQDGDPSMDTNRDVRSAADAVFYDYKLGGFSGTGKSFQEWVKSEDRRLNRKPCK